MTTGYSPFPQGYDATTAADRFASSYDLERIAATRPDLHAILAANPSIPPQVRAVLERSDDVVVQEVLARQAGRGAPLAGPPIPQAQPAQAQALEQIDAMAPTMAVGTAGAQPPQGTSTQATAPQGYGTTAAQSQQSPLPQDPSQADQQVALPPSAQIHSSPSMQSAAQPMGQWPAMPPGVRAGMPSGHVLGHGQVATTAYGAPMYVPPAQPKKRRGLKILAVVLPIVLLMAGGGVAAWYFCRRETSIQALRSLPSRTPGAREPTRHGAPTSLPTWSRMLSAIISSHSTGLTPP